MLILYSYHFKPNILGQYYYCNPSLFFRDFNLVNTYGELSCFIENEL